jgi:hypothetical protein
MATQLGPNVLDSYRHATAFDGGATATSWSLPTQSAPLPAVVPSPANSHHLHHHHHFSAPLSLLHPHQQQQQQQQQQGPAVPAAPFGFVGSDSNLSSLYSETSSSTPSDFLRFGSLARDPSPYPNFVSPASIDNLHPLQPAFHMMSWDEEGAGAGGGGFAPRSIPVATSPLSPRTPWGSRNDPHARYLDEPHEGELEEEDDNTRADAHAPPSSRHKRPRKTPAQQSSGGRSARRASSGPMSPTSVSQTSTGGASSVSAPTTAGAGSSSRGGSVSGSSITSKLRSAPRSSKTARHHKPADTAEERRTRSSHNLVEKQYRNRLNAHFESLLQALPEQLRSGAADDDDEGGGGGGAPAPPDGSGDRRLSKGQVLDLARRHIKTLERQRDAMHHENQEFVNQLNHLERVAGDAGLLPLDVRPSSSGVGPWRRRPSSPHEDGDDDDEDDDDDDDDDHLGT